MSVEILTLDGPIAKEAVRLKAPKPFVLAKIPLGMNF
jgi:hypothetical protein